MPNHPPQNITVATTGASGSIFLKHFLLALERDQRVQTVNFIASDSALRVMAEELGLRGLNRARTEFAWSVVAKRHLDFFDEILAAPPG